MMWKKYSAIAVTAVLAATGCGLAAAGAPTSGPVLPTRDGIVTLSGSVDRYTAKREAEETAESVRGVHAVINNLDVRPRP